MLFVFVMLIYGGRTERLSVRPFLIMTAAALIYTYLESLVFGRSIGTQTLLYALLYLAIGLLLFFAGHFAVNRLGRDRNTL